MRRRADPLRLTLAVLMVLGDLGVIAALFAVDVPQNNRDALMVMLTLMVRETGAVFASAFPMVDRDGDGKPDPTPSA